MKKLMKVLAVACLSMTALTACSKPSEPSAPTDNGNANDPIKIGLHFELTGNVADYGTAEAKGANLAIKQANAAGGNFVAVEYDNKSDLPEANQLATKLTAEGVVGIVGPATSGLSSATYPIAEGAQTVVISPSATANNVTLTNPQDATSAPYEYIFRTCFEDSYQGSAMATFAADNLGLSKAVVFWDSSTDYAKGLASAFIDKFEAKGGEIVANENYVAGETDFNSVLTKVKDKDFDILYIPGYYQEVGLIIKQARAMGIDVAIGGGDGFESTSLVELAGADNLNKVFFTTSYTTVGANDELKAFVDAYKAEYNEEPNMFSALAYDSTNLLIQAVNEAGSTDKEAVKEAVKKISFKGVTGEFTFDAKHSPIKTVLVVELVNGVQENAVSVNP